MSKSIVSRILFSSLSALFLSYVSAFAATIPPSSSAGCRPGAMHQGTYVLLNQLFARCVGSVAVFQSTSTLNAGFFGVNYCTTCPSGMELQDVTVSASQYGCGTITYSTCVDSDDGGDDDDFSDVDGGTCTTSSRYCYSCSEKKTVCPDGWMMILNTCRNISNLNTMFENDVGYYKTTYNTCTAVERTVTVSYACSTLGSIMTCPDGTTSKCAMQLGGLTPAPGGK